MSYEQALRDHDLMLMNPPVIDAPDEPCDGNCRNDLGDTAVKMRRGGYDHFYCEDCAATVERCDQCHCIRCECES